MARVAPDEHRVTEMEFADGSLVPAVRGYVDRLAPARRAEASGSAREGVTDLLILAHGAASNCRAPLLVAVARAFALRGFTVLRCDLPFRQKRGYGPPLRTAAEDRDGLRNAVEAMKKLVPESSPCRVFLGGHSYGGRQASMLAASDRGLVDGLLLLSYPLHPPDRPADPRTAHFPELRTPALFVHGTRDPFGSLNELESAAKLIPAATRILPVEGAGHDLSFGRRSRRSAAALPEDVVTAFVALTRPAVAKGAHA